MLIELSEKVRVLAMDILGVVIGSRKCLGVIGHETWRRTTTAYLLHMHNICSLSTQKQHFLKCQIFLHWGLTSYVLEYTNKKFARSIIHKCHFIYECITGEYRQPSFVNFGCMCFKFNFRYIAEVLLRSNLAQVKCPVSSTVDLSQ